MPQIVLVEDDPEDLRMILSKLGDYCPENRIAVARDGAEAIDVLLSDEVRQHPPKLILLDLKLPKVSGLDVLRRVRASHLSTIPVVVLTSSRESPDLQRAYQLGANSYLCKPLEFEAFVKVVDSIGAYWVVLNEHPTA